MLARIPSRGRDDDGMEYGPHVVAAIRGEALASLGRYGEAADVVLDAVRSEGVLEADVGELVHWLLQAERSPAEITAALCVEDLVPMLGRVLRQPPPLADVLLDGAWARFPDRLEPLAAAAIVAPRLPLARALVWSARLRQRGLAASCPLLDDRSRRRDRSRRQGAGGRGALRIVPRRESRRHRPGRAGRTGPDRQARFPRGDPPARSDPAVGVGGCDPTDHANRHDSREGHVHEPSGCRSFPRQPPGAHPPRGRPARSRPGYSVPRRQPGEEASISSARSRGPASRPMWPAGWRSRSVPEEFRYRRPRTTGTTGISGRPGHIADPRTFLST